LYELGRLFVENDTILSSETGVDKKIAGGDEESHNNMFIVLSSLKSGTNKNDYKLKKGDIIKLGRIKFRVKDMRTESMPSYLDCGKSQNSPSPVKHQKHIS
jgi:hypothetical protein